MAHARKIDDTRTVTRGDSESGAIFSRCETYRYVLWRRWSSILPLLVIVGLNPSTADHTVDDNTIKKLIRMAKLNNFGGIMMVNLFAYRSTDPKGMLEADDPVGPHNMFYLGSVFHNAHTILCAWGKDGVHKGQDEDIMLMLDHVGERTKVCCLGINKNGTPKHPLYQPDNTVFQEYGKCVSSLPEQENLSITNS